MELLCRTKCVAGEIDSRLLHLCLQLAYIVSHRKCFQLCMLTCIQCRFEALCQPLAVSGDLCCVYWQKYTLPVLIVVPV
jgi:hypothetical protein